MKFGQSFHRYVVPEWEPFYVRYGQLKKLFKTATEHAALLKAKPNFTELYESLTNNINSFNAFRYQKYEYLHQKEEDLYQRYGIPPNSSILPRFDEVDRYELNELFECFAELRRDLFKLQSFDRLNEDALGRIFSKIERFDDSIDQSYRSHKYVWQKSQRVEETEALKEIERLDKLLAEINTASSYGYPDSKRTSLYLKHLCDQQSPSVIYPGAVYHAIRNDDGPTLAKHLDHNALSNVTLLKGLLDFSVTCQSKECIDILLSYQKHDSPLPIGAGSIIHLLATVGQNSQYGEVASKGCTSLNLTEKPNSRLGTSALLQMLNRYQSEGPLVWQQRDSLQRLPLHYGALYGLTEVCESIITAFTEATDDASVVKKVILSEDFEGSTPLDLAVVNGHTAVVRLFLTFLESGGKPLETSKDSVTDILSRLLHVALRYEFDEIVHLLEHSPMGSNTWTCHGKTALYVAAQIGRADYVKVLLSEKSDHSKDLNLAEYAYGWTPLFVACSEGYLEVVDALLQAHADQNVVDLLGWTAREHAALRGNLTVATMLQDCKIENLSGGPATKSLRRIKGAHYVAGQPNSYIVVNLGIMDKGRHRSAINLDLLSSNKLQSRYMDTRYSIEITGPEANGLSYLVRLPILNEMINEPFVFDLKDGIDPRLVFKVFCATSSHGKKGRLVGSGVVLLESNKNCFGPDRESLVREQTVPILEKDTLQAIGTVTFTSVIGRPFKHPNTPTPEAETSSVQLVGHRGLGQNNGERKHLQIGENTVESFLASANTGAPYVEFDVQLTRDLVPIIFHDFSLSESGTDIPIHDLTLEQYLYASEIQSPHGSPISILGEPQKHKGNKPRSRSLTKFKEREAIEVRERMKHTVDFMSKGFKPNTRGDFIQDSFATLEDLLVKLPESVGFDIEIKYPRIHEAAAVNVAPVVISINTFIDRSLELIFKYAKTRRIILSSFTPEVCILLATKQSTYPVSFITNVGKPPITDKEKRAESIQTAVRFAKHWGLNGVVFASEALVMCPRLIGYVKAAGLNIGSYGPLNNEPETAMMQVHSGIDLLVADKVGLIAKTLKEAKLL